MLQPDSRRAPRRVSSGTALYGWVIWRCESSCWVRAGGTRSTLRLSYPSSRGPGDLQVQAEKNKWERSKFSRASKKAAGGPGAGLARPATPSTQAASSPSAVTGRSAPCLQSIVWGHDTIPHLKSSKLLAPPFLAPPPLLPYSTLRWEPAHSFPRSRLRR